MRNRLNARLAAPKGHQPQPALTTIDSLLLVREDRMDRRAATACVSAVGSVPAHVMTTLHPMELVMATDQRGPQIGIIID